MNSENHLAQPDPGPVYPISAVSRMTGVRTVTLRAWEHRHGLVRPSRTERGYRLYTDRDVLRIREIVKLLGSGIPVSRVAQILGKDPANPEPHHVEEHGQQIWHDSAEQMLAAISQFDYRLITTIYEKLLCLYPVNTVTRKLLLPVLARVGDQSGPDGKFVAEEHFFSAFVRNKLEARLHHRSLPTEGPGMIAACLPGELHELGLLLLAIMAHDLGYRVFVFGANLPLDAIPELVRRTRAAGIVLSCSMGSHLDACEDALCLTARTVPVPVFVGGPGANGASVKLQASGLYLLGDELETALRIISRLLKPAHAA